MKPPSLIFSATLASTCFALPSFTPSAQAAVPSVAAPNSLSTSSTLTTIERLSLPPSARPQSPRSSFHLATTSSCNAAQTQCVAACSSQTGQAAQNCISDCNDLRTTCQ